MAQTFIASSDTLSAYQNTVVAPTVAMDERNPHRAHFALFNTLGSNSIVRIREISVSPMNLQGVTLNTVNLSLITAHNGGDTVSPYKLDSTNATFPTAVEVRSNVLSYTAATGSHVRAQIYPSALLGLTLSYPFGRKNTLHRWMTESTDIQKITLRNGEGLAITEPNYPNTYNFPCLIDATVRISDTGACYAIRAYTNSNQPALLTILNNGYTAGNVELLKLTIESVRGGTLPTTTADLPSYHTLAILEGYNESVNGTAITPKSMDSTNSLNSYIKLYRDLDVGYFYARAGNLATNSLMFRTIPQSSSFATPMFTPVKQTIFKSSGAENDLVVREGMGIALLQPDFGAYGSSYDIDCVFTQESTTASAIYPAESDVENGTVYGPNGTDYTGNVTLPAVEDVETGVQYGASGTEFTGTLTGGGGGNVFIINE